MGYETPEGAQNALKLDGDEYWGRTIRVQYASKEKDKEQVFEAFVKGFSQTVTDDFVKGVFATCGEIDSLRLPRNAEGEVKGVAFIRFRTEESLNKALELNNTKVADRVLAVEKATSDNGKGKGKGKGKDGKGKGKDKHGKGKGKGKGKDKGKGKSKK